MSDRDLPEKRNPNADSPFGFVSNAWHGLSRPLRILFVTTVLCLGAGAAFIGVRKVSEPYATLFGALPEADAAAVVAKLKELKVPHRVVDGGRIEVPEERVHEIRLEMAGAGLPRGGAVGFENFDKMKLGATEFEQKVMFRRALEGELARTIGSVQAVEAARVHLVMPERSMFANRREPASASVVVKLRQGREIGNPEIGAIVHLVASAVPGLSQDRVTLATTEGALLKRPKSATEGGGAETGLADDQLAEVRALEASLEERARTMLERVVGAGHVDVRVAADIDFSRVELTEDRFKPGDPILRSEELMVERTGATEGTVAGVPGAESNLPTGDAPEEGDAPAGAAGVLRRQHTRNFEVDRVTERRVRQAGIVKRLTVAVVVDGVSTTDESGAVTFQARDEAELEKLEALVRSAVGADDNRQDVVTLQSMSFVSAPVADAGLIAPVAATPLEKAKPYLPFVAAGGIFLALVTATMLTRRRSTVTAVELLPSGELKRENELLSEDAPLLLNARDEALRRASEDPATAALVVRHWLGMGSAAEDGSSRAA